MTTVTVVGGGLGGLIAAIECADRGAQVELLEARARLGGRAAFTSAPWIAGLGPHALYTGGSLWSWLTARKLHSPARRSPLHGFHMRHAGRRRVVPPSALLRGLPMMRGAAPVDVDLRTWVTERKGPETAALIGGLAGVLTFDHDPGRLSAAFVASKIRRLIMAFPPVTRYPVGGWSVLIARLAAFATSRGVRIATGAKVDTLPDPPVILAVDPRAARDLLNDPDLGHAGTETALLDVGLDGTPRGETFNFIDLDEAGFAERFTAIDPSLARPGATLIQALIGRRPTETLDEAVARLEALLDIGWPTWRRREVWRRRALVREASGALDSPGHTWHDRAAIARGDGVWLVGDWVAAPGHLSEVSAASAQIAAIQACNHAPASDGEHDDHTALSH
jgi:phytoene dehydrogenase-like protein